MKAKALRSVRSGVAYFSSLKDNESLRPAYIMGKLNSLDTTSLF